MRYFGGSSLGFLQIQPLWMFTRSLSVDVYFLLPWVAAWEGDGWTVRSTYVQLCKKPPSCSPKQLSFSILVIGAGKYLHGLANLGVASCLVLAAWTAVCFPSRFLIPSGAQHLLVGFTITGLSSLVTFY